MSTQIPSSHPERNPNLQIKKEASTKSRPKGKMGGRIGNRKKYMKMKMGGASQPTLQDLANEVYASKRY
jgi:hypothetical protein